MTQNDPSPHATITAAEAIRLIAGWTDLTKRRRDDLIGALSSFCAMAGLPPGSLVLTPDNLRKTVLDRPASAYGLADSTMKTLRSAVRFILRRIGIIDTAYTPIDPVWQKQLDLLGDKHRLGLVGFARYGSATGVPPEAVSLATLDAYQAYLEERSLKAPPAKATGAVRTAWNKACDKVEGWAGQRLEKRTRPGQFVLPPEAFPESFQADLAAFGARLAATDLDGAEDDDEDTPLGRGPGLKPKVAKLRQEHARWAASALVGSGKVPIDAITSLAELVSPVSRAKHAILFLYDRVGRKPSPAGMHVAEVLHMIAAHHLHRPEAELRKIKDWAKLVRMSYRGMTERNQKAVNDAIQPDRIEALLELPGALMRVARDLRTKDREGAQSLALRAVAVGILTQIPLRLANLAGLRLDKHLHRPDTRKGTFSHVMIPDDEMKTGNSITLPVASRTAGLIDEWVRLHRPDTGAGTPWLFPGYGPVPGKAIGHQGLRSAIKDAVFEHAGVEITPHQFRHLAARLFLETFPGHYEEVPQLLGHASVVTTTRHYSGIERETSARRYDEEVLGARRTTPKAGSPKRGKTPPASPRAPRPGKGPRR